MSVVIDANLIAAVVLPLPYSGQATQRVIGWNEPAVVLTMRRTLAIRWNRLPKLTAMSKEDTKGEM
jgi:hypothetical protein